MSGDPYRERVRAMAATEHFGTDYLPIHLGPPECLCDSEPGVFAVFTFAVLALHRPRRRSHSATPTCSCGQSLATCPVQSLAHGLLFAPDARVPPPERNAP